MKSFNHHSHFAKPVGLSVITEGQQLLNQKGNTKFRQQKAQLFISPKKKVHETENMNLYTMPSEKLKQSVENDPFIRAKLKCMIKSTQKSLNKENFIKSPKHYEKSNLTESNHLQTVYRLKKQRKVQQSEKMHEFLEIMRENDKKLVIQSKVSRQKQNHLYY